MGDEYLKIDTSAVPAYRDHLVKAREKAQADFDKTLLSLSGGALGITFAFVSNFIDSNPIVYPGLLVFAWSSWGISAVCVLFSFYMSHWSLDNTIQEIDKGRLRYRPGGWAARVTQGFNFFGGAMFFVGVVVTAVFVYWNLI